MNVDLIEIFSHCYRELRFQSSKFYAFVGKCSNLPGGKSPGSVYSLFYGTN